MSNWTKIKNGIYSEKIAELDNLFNEIETNLTNTPRSYWLEPIDDWATDQITNDVSLKLNLNEYAYIKKVVDDLQTNLIYRHGEEEQVLKEFKQEIINDYSGILNNKEEDLKLEVAAELTFDKKLPIYVIGEWYVKNFHLTPEQFDEALGEFWGDVWKHAAKGAGVGAMAGGLTGGNFAGAGLGGLAGGAVGGLYGAGKHLLQRVWQWRQDQQSFEETKQKALESLKKLKDISRKFDFNDNFNRALDFIIEKLGSARAYKAATSNATFPGQVAPVPTAMPAKPKSDIFRSLYGPTPKVTEPEDKDKQEKERIARDKAVAEKVEKERAEKDRAEKLQAINNINTEEDILKLIRSAKAASDEETLLRIGLTLSNIMPGGNAKDFKDNYHALDGLNMQELPELGNMEDMAIAAIDEFEKSQKEIQQISSPGKPTSELPNESPALETPDKAKLLMMDTGDLREYVKKKGLGHMLGKGEDKKIGGVGKIGTPTRENAVEKILFYLQHPEVAHESFEEKVNYFKKLLKG